jgi:hypothetical protein
VDVLVRLLWGRHNPTFPLSIGERLAFAARTDDAAQLSVNVQLRPT